MKEIEVFIDKNGNLKYRVYGAKGRECISLTEFLDALGEIEKREFTDEYYQENLSHLETLEKDTLENS